jgi:hypothetical protein
MNPIDTILDRLESVRKRQLGQYSARCPAHDDKGPSLSVRESTDGAVLIHCFAGCTPHEILASIDLELHDLFPPRERPQGAPQRIPRLLTAAQALELLSEKATLVAVAAGNVGHGATLSPKDRDDVIQAARYINWIRHEATGGHHAQS